MVDIVRKKSNAPKWLRTAVLLAVIAGTLVATTAGLSKLDSALPEFALSSVTLDTVQRGRMVREVRGSGTLVPVDVTWVTTEVGGSVVEVLVEPGVTVSTETILLKLFDPYMERAVRDARRIVELAEADVKRLELQQKAEKLDLKVATATAYANFQDARTQAELNETLARQGLISLRQWKLSKDRAERNRMLLEAQIERARNSEQTQKIQLQERQASVAQAQDRLAERLEQQEALVVKSGTQGVLQQLGAAGGDLEVGQRVSQGAVVAKITNPSRLKAVLQIAQTQARDVVVGQPASIDTRNGVIEGRVLRIDPAVQNDRVPVDVELIGQLPRGARPDLSVEGLIEVARLDDVFFVRKPVYSQDGGRLEVFRLEPRTQMASRTMVEFGSSSVHTIEVVAGLREGDQIVVSDTTRWRSLDRVKLK